jgi:hypothetical protein
MDYMLDTLVNNKKGDKFFKFQLHRDREWAEAFSQSSDKLPML